jgi:radical SAM/Cys-rich protein
MIPDFNEKVTGATSQPLILEKLETLQVNLGNKCNQSCRHCHVKAGPAGKRIMPKSVMQKIIHFISKHKALTVDITGGCPELNPNFKFFIENIFKSAWRIIVRTNLSVFFEPGLDWIPDWYREHKVAIIASLPCYTKENVDQQRGSGVFDKSIKAIKILNKLGYGQANDLELNLVYNPGGEFLPASQTELESAYKTELSENYGITFNRLLTITNAPIGRFKNYLEANGKLKQYLQLLVDNFNPETTNNIMCRILLSIDFRGIIYNCDFNQALDLPVIDPIGNIVTIDTIENVLNDVEIITGSHCFCCTAGAGSSCTGTLLK